MKKIDDEIIDLLKKEKTVTLGFSTGRDSVTCASILKKMHIKVIPFYFYHVPDLKFIEKTIKMYEDFFEFEVIQLPHPMLTDYLRHQDFQPPKMIDFLADFKIPKFSFHSLMQLHFDSIGKVNNHYDINGMRACESFNRRMVFKKQGAINHKEKKISLIADWTKADVENYLKENKIPISDDYKIWNRSFDGLKYQFLFGVKENYPDDYERIKEFFPLIDLELRRYEFNQKYAV